MTVHALTEGGNMRRRLNPRWSTALILLWALGLAGCQPPPPPTSITILHARQVGDPVVTIDAATGDRIRTTQWRYPDGVTVATIERIPVGGDNEFRRNPREPEPRVFTDD